MFQYCTTLLLVYAREPLHELVDRGTAGHVLEQSVYWHPCAGEAQTPLILPGLRSTAGQLLQSVIRSPPVRPRTRQPVPRRPRGHVLQTIATASQQELSVNIADSLFARFDPEKETSAYAAP